MRLEQLTFTRFLAAMGVVMFHYGVHFYPFNNENLAFLLLKGNVAVSYFFILSGFIMIIAYGKFDKVKPIEYLKNRIARLYPLLVIAVILELCFALLFVPAFGINRIMDVIFVLLGIQSWIPGKSLVFLTPAWSISVEFFFYLVFPFLFNKYYTKIKLSVLANIIILFWIFSQLLLNYIVASPFFEPYPAKICDFTFYSPLMHLNEFLIGNLAGLFFIKNIADKRANFDMLIIAIISIFLVCFKFIPVQYHNGFYAFIFIPFIIFTALNNGVITKIFNNRICIFLGEISFAIYILHVPLYDLMDAFTKKYTVLNPTLFFWIYLTVLFVVSSLSYLYIEKPMRNVIKNLDVKPILRINR